MKLYIITSGHMLGSSDAAYLHGVFLTSESAEKAKLQISSAGSAAADSLQVHEMEADEIELGDPDDYHGISGKRII